MRGFCRRGALLLLPVAVTTVAAAVGVTAAPPAEAHSSHPGGVTETCPEVQSTQPGRLEKVTNPVHGSVVHPGQIVEVRLSWDPAHFSGDRLHKALDCVTADGLLLEQVSVQERDPANDGEFFYTFAVPPGLAAGTDLCDRGFVSGPSPDGGFEREASEDVCLEVGAPPAPEGPAPEGRPPTEVLPQAEVLPQIGEPLTEVRPEQTLPGGLEDVSQVIERERPGTEVQPLLVLDSLPRTGAGRALLVTAGLALAVGGGALALATPRRRRLD